MGQNFGPNPGNGQYYPITIQGDLFNGANQAVVATAINAGLGVTLNGGLVLVNPLTSQKNLILQKATAAFVVAQTNASVIGIAVGYSAVSAVTGTLTTVPNQNGLASSSNVSSGNLYSSASIVLPVAPTLVKILGAVDTGALTTEVDPAKIEADIQGSIVIPPGGYACFASSAAGTASSFMGSFSWVEQSSGAVA